MPSYPQQGRHGYGTQIRLTGRVADGTFTTGTTAYADNDVLGSTLEFDGFYNSNYGTGNVVSLLLIDKADQGAAIDVYFLDSNVSFGTDNAAVSISDADATAVLGKVSITASDYYDLGGVRVAEVGNLAIKVASKENADSLYVALVARGAATYAAASLVLRVGADID